MARQVTRSRTDGYPRHDELASLVMGVGLAAATVAVLSPLPGGVRLMGLAILLGLAGGVYPGFAGSEENGEARGLEWAIALGFAVVALVGAVYGPVLLAMGWIGHALWDLAHHRERVGARTPADYPWLCLAYDVVIAGYLIVGGRTVFPPIPLT